MMLPLASQLQSLSKAKHAAAVVGSFVALGVVNAILNASYRASNHPVGHAEGQTTFSGDQVKSFYAVMQEAGTLSLYTRSQIIDLGFIATMVLFGICLGTFLARIHRAESLGSKAGYVTAGATIIGSLFDAAENLVSFVMLANPQTFPNWLAVPYSAFAAVKFAFITLGMVAALVSIVAWVVTRLGRPSSIN